MAFLAWFVLPAVLWPYGIAALLGLPLIAVACVYLATVGLIYLAVSGRSARRRLNSTYPDHH